MKNLNNKIIGSILVLLIIIMCLKPETVITGGKEGINICLNIIIPSLFPFMFIVNMLITGNYLNINGSNKLSSVLIVYLLSCLGGYPVGGKTCEDLYSKKIIDKKSAKMLTCFCTHSGPGFIILNIGIIKYGNALIGALLFTAHIIPTLILGIFLYNKISFNNFKNSPPKQNFSSVLITSANNTSNAIIGICSFIVMFSVILSFINNGIKNSIARTAGSFLEISGGINNVKNIYFVSFLLGFGGLCVFSQIISVTKKIELNLSLFLLSRVYHGLLSSIIMFGFVKIFKIRIISGNIIADYTFINSYNKVLLSLSMLLMIVVLLLSLSRQNKGGNLINDIV